MIQNISRFVAGAAGEKKTVLFGIGRAARALFWKRVHFQRKRNPEP
jgi:hypothetical protein